MNFYFINKYILDIFEIIKIQLNIQLKSIYFGDQKVTIADIASRCPVLN